MGHNLDDARPYSLSLFDPVPAPKQPLFFFFSVSRESPLSPWKTGLVHKPAKKLNHSKKKSVSVNKKE